MTRKKATDKINETMDKARETMTTINKTGQQAVDQYIELGMKVQDEMFEMAQRQLDGFRQYTEFALKQQVEFFSQFEKNAKNTRVLWLEGLKKARTAATDLVDDK